MSEEKKRILVIGDIMLDRYVYVNTKRQAPEAPIPVWDEEKEEIRLGGAANVANNLCSIGEQEVEVFMAGIFRKTEVNRVLTGNGINTLLCTHGQTMVKTRYVNQDKIVFRSDHLQHFDPEEVLDFEESFGFLSMHQGPTWDAVVISDYDKGTVTPAIVDSLKALRVPLVVVDSKRKDLSMYQGFNVLKVNDHEHGLQTTFSQIYSYPFNSVEGLFDYCVVTQGAKGASLLQCEKTKSRSNRCLIHRENFPIDPVKVVDVTGCGDTHTAALTFCMLKTGDIRRSIKFANLCSRSVVTKFGTSVAKNELIINEPNQGDT